MPFEIQIQSRAENPHRAASRADIWQHHAPMRPQLFRAGENEDAAIRGYLADLLTSWKSVGFEDSYQEETYRRAGLEQLRQFVEQQNGRTIAKNIRLEESFALDCGNVILEGRIDQINPLDTPESRDHTSRAGSAPVELVDYKTGRPRSQRDADKSLQLSVYALAASRGLKLDPVRLTLYHLSNGQAVSTARTVQDLDVVLQQIAEVADNIRKSAFAPSKGWACKWCEFVPVCPEHEDEG